MYSSEQIEMMPKTDQSAFISPGDFAPSRKQNCIVKARFGGNQS